MDLRTDIMHTEINLLFYDSNCRHIVLDKISLLMSSLKALQFSKNTLLINQIMMCFKTSAYDQQQIKCLPYNIIMIKH